ncbi:MAG: peptidoglycan-binding protein [Betaproteobacteria bacterium]|nr:MAG: peptidoglycan-binding protein [Betaproteobacteria bacterium]
MLEEVSAKHEPPIRDEDFAPYVTRFRGRDEAGSYEYYFTDRGHFAHPSVLIARKVFAEDGTFEVELKAATARTREDLEKWIRVIAKRSATMEAYKADAQALEPICRGFEVGSPEHVRCAEKLAREHPDSYWAHDNLGTAYLYAGDELGTRRVFEVLKEKGDWLLVQIMFLGFGVAVMHPEWYEYYFEEIEIGNRVYEAQQLLDALGYETGPLRAVIGSELEQAIKAFQRDANLPVNGEVTEALLEKLRAWGKREDVESIQ